MSSPYGRPRTADPTQWPGTFPLRPLAAGEVMTAGIAVVRRHFWALGPLAFAFSLISALVQWGVLTVGGSVDDYTKWVESALQGGQTSIPGPILASAALSTLVIACTMPVLIALATVYAGQDAVGRPAAKADLARRLAGRWPMLLLTAVVVGVAGVIGTTLLIIPGVLVFLFWAFATPVVVMERADLTTALRRSALLTQGGRGRLLGLSLLGALAGVLGSTVLGALVAGMTSTMSGTAAAITSSVVTAVVEAFTYSWTAAMIGVLYIDARMRRERLGEALWAAAHTPPAGPAEPAR